MLLIASIQAITVILCLITGLFVYRKGVKNPINISFAVLCLFVAAWVTVGLIWELQLKWHILPDLISRLGVAFGSMLTASLITFSTYFPVRSEQIGKRWLILNYSLALFIAISAFTPLSVSDAYYEGDKFIRVFGPLYALFAAYAIGGCLLVAVIMSKKYRRLQHELDKQKVKYLTFGVIISLLLIIFFMFIFPYFGYYQLFYIGQLFPIIFVSFASYAILRYHALDISSFASKVLGWVCHVIIVIAILYTSVFFTRDTLRSQNDFVVTMMMLLVLVLVLLYLRKVKPVIDSIILYKEINMSRVLEDFSKELNVLKPLTELADDVQRYLKNILTVDRVSILHHHPANGYYFEGDIKVDTRSLEACQLFIDYLEDHDEILEAERIEKDPDYYFIRESAKLYFDLVSSVLVVPLVFNKKLLGILNLGNKRGHMAYNSTELQLLSILRRDISVALNNSRLYQTVKDLYKQVIQLNETLEERVNARTADLQEALSQLKHVDKLKSDFISVASHELRTPITAVKGAIDLALEYDMESEVGRVVRHLIKMSQRNIDRLIVLINDVLDLAKLEAAKNEYVYDRVDINEIVINANDSVASLIEKKQLKLAVSLPDQPTLVEGDYQRLFQVMVNLLGNAIKYSPEQGTITVTVLQRQGWMEYAVTDQGEGIQPDFQQKIFEKFSQIRDAESKKEGTGLGLAIAKQIIDNYHGTIWAENTSEHGSCFKFRLALANR